MKCIFMHYYVKLHMYIYNDIYNIFMQLLGATLAKTNPVMQNLNF